MNEEQAKVNELWDKAKEKLERSRWEVLPESDEYENKGMVHNRGKRREEIQKKHTWMWPGLYMSCEN